MRRSASRAARYAAQAGLSSRKHGCKWHYIFRKSWNSISLPTRNQRLARNLPMGLSKLGLSVRILFGARESRLCPFDADRRWRGGGEPVPLARRLLAAPPDV